MKYLGKWHGDGDFSGQKFLEGVKTFLHLSHFLPQLLLQILNYMTSLRRLIPQCHLKICAIQWQFKVYASTGTNDPVILVLLSWERQNDLSCWINSWNMFVEVPLSELTFMMRLDWVSACRRRQSQVFGRGIRITNSFLFWRWGLFSFHHAFQGCHVGPQGHAGEWQHDCGGISQQVRGHLSAMFLSSLPVGKADAGMD